MQNIPIDLRDLARDRNSIAALAAHLISDVHGGEDLAQESVYRMLRVGEPHSHGNRLAWLRTTIRRLAANEHRGRGSRQQREQEAARPEAVLSSDQIAERAELCQRVHRAIDSLPREQGRLLRDHYFGGLAASEIARRDGISISNVKSRVHRARAALRGALERDGIGDDVHWSIALAPLVVSAPRAAVLAPTLTGSAGAAFTMNKIVSFTVVLIALFMGGHFILSDADRQVSPSSADTGVESAAVLALGGDQHLAGIPSQASARTRTPPAIDHAAPSSRQFLSLQLLSENHGLVQAAQVTIRNFSDRQRALRITTDGAGKWSGQIPSGYSSIGPVFDSSQHQLSVTDAVSTYDEDHLDLKVFVGEPTSWKFRVADQYTGQPIRKYDVFVQRAHSSVRSLTKYYEVSSPPPDDAVREAEGDSDGTSSILLSHSPVVVWFVAPGYESRAIVTTDLACDRRILLSKASKISATLLFAANEFPVTLILNGLGDNVMIQRRIAASQSGLFDMGSAPHGRYELTVAANSASVDSSSLTSCNFELSGPIVVPITVGSDPVNDGYGAISASVTCPSSSPLFKIAQLTIKPKAARSVHRRGNALRNWRRLSKDITYTKNFNMLNEGTYLCEIRPVGLVEEVSIIPGTVSSVDFDLSLASRVPLLFTGDGPNDSRPYVVWKYTSEPESVWRPCSIDRNGDAYFFALPRVVTLSGSKGDAFFGVVEFDLSGEIDKKGITIDLSLAVARPNAQIDITTYFIDEQGAMIDFPINFWSSVRFRRTDGSTRWSFGKSLTMIDGAADASSCTLKFPGEGSYEIEIPGSSAGDGVRILPCQVDAESTVLLIEY